MSVLPFAGGGVVPGGNEAPNVGVVVDPGTPVLVGIDGVNVPFPSPVGDAVAVAVGVVGVGAAVLPLAGGMDPPNVGVVVDPGTPVLVGIDGVNVPFPSPVVGDVVTTVGAVGEGPGVPPLAG